MSPKPTPSLEETIKLIFERYDRYCECEEYHIHSSTDDDLDVNTDEPLSEHEDFDEEAATQAILQALKDHLMNVIGEDEDMHKILEPGEKINRVEYGRYLAVRNQLRHEIRSKLEALASPTGAKDGK